ncbi:hypothetical protein OF83DRAFT_1177947 [Amylostereum chailletii]|nr:hypothetical protein OF83DRAFT_1177947 [Amylostereum chailletii]
MAPGFATYRARWTGWEAGVGVNRYRWLCKACNDDNWRDLKSAKRHQATRIHLDCSSQYLRILEESEDPEQLAREYASIAVPGPLSHVLHDLSQPPEPEAPVLASTPDPAPIPDHDTTMLYWDEMRDDLAEPFQAPIDQEALAQLSGSLDWLQGQSAPESDNSSMDSDDSRNAVREEAAEDDVFIGAKRVRCLKDLWDENPAWFPYPDKESCILDVLRHLPRSVFSDAQTEIILWGMSMFGISNLPSVGVMKALDADLQDLYGIRSIRYDGALGHPYYVNNLADIIAQEMANPRVHPHLRHYPEATNSGLSNAWQADRWLNELDEALLSPMVRIGSTGKDFYTLEPVKLTSGRVCMPLQWFTRARDQGGRQVQEFYAKVCHLQPISRDHGSGWVMHEFDTFDVPARELGLTFPELLETWAMDGLPDPRIIHGTIKAREGELDTWTHTLPAAGNPWRAHAQGHRVLAFPIWLYCDDTSGNLSKKWDKHNSFLFTPAGLPRELAQKEYNVHFLATSNIAPPLEMLDGIADQIESAQMTGIWAWDCVHQEMVLLIPVIMALLGDNPMQSEFACHNPPAHSAAAAAAEGGEGNDSDSVASAGGSETAAGSGDEQERTTSKGKKTETMQELVDRARRFLGPITLRTKDETLQDLRTMFTDACTLGKMTQVGKLKTERGVKDTFLEHFLDKVSNFSKRLKGKTADKQNTINEYIQELPEFPVSPVWRIKSLDPHTDTPVEVLHMVLLGFVKYFWRDAVGRLDATGKSTLTTRLNSVDVSGLGISPLSGQTLVQPRITSGMSFSLVLSYF